MRIKQNRTFSKLSAFFDSYYNGLRSKIEQGILVFPSSESQSLGKMIFSDLKWGGMATFIVSGKNIWNPEDLYYEAQRKAARRGCKITRIFLVPHRRFIKEPVVIKHSNLDEAAGIKVKFVYAGKLISRKVIPPPYTLDFGIWDKSLVCFVYYLNYEGNIVPYEWRVSIRPEDLEFASSLLDDILENKDLLIDPNIKDLELDLEEPMLKSAPLMSMLSEVMCKGSQVSAEDCSWYHRVWQYLRIFDVVSTPTWHYRFYFESLRRLFAMRKNIKILISGTADYSMLAHVLYAFSNTDTKYEITVLDLCQTPLVLCEWYAGQEGKKIKTIREDILKFNIQEHFDLIITDAFLTRFSDDEKLQVLKKWNSLLKKDGIIITTIRIEKSDGPTKTSETEISKFTNEVFKSAQNWQPFLPESAEKLSSWAHEYARRMISFPVKNKDFLHKLLIKSGFSVIQDNMVRVKGEMHKTYYIELIAKKIEELEPNAE